MFIELSTNGASMFQFMNALELINSVRKLPQIENNMKIEASISLRRRDEEVKVHGEPDCCNLG